MFVVYGTTGPFDLERQNSRGKGQATAVVLSHLISVSVGGSLRQRYNVHINKKCCTSNLLICRRNLRWNIFFSNCL